MRIAPLAPMMCIWSLLDLPGPSASGHNARPQVTAAGSRRATVLQRAELGCEALCPAGPFNGRRNISGVLGGQLAQKASIMGALLIDGTACLLTSKQRDAPSRWRAFCRQRGHWKASASPSVRQWSRKPLMQEPRAAPPAPEPAKAAALLVERGLMPKMVAGTWPHRSRNVMLPSADALHQ